MFRFKVFLYVFRQIFPDKISYSGTHFKMDTFLGKIRKSFWEQTNPFVFEPLLFSSRLGVFLIFIGIVGFEFIRCLVHENRMRTLVIIEVNVCFNIGKRVNYNRLSAQSERAHDGRPLKKHRKKSKKNFIKKQLTYIPK